MKWKKMKRILDDFNITPEFLIHAELDEEAEYYKIL